MILLMTYFNQRHFFPASFKAPLTFLASFSENTLFKIAPLYLLLLPLSNSNLTNLDKIIFTASDEKALTIQLIFS